MASAEVYREVKPVATKGVYFDNAGYYARYTVTSIAPGQATFISDIIPGFPRYRVSYSSLPDGRLGTLSAMDLEARGREPGSGEAVENRASPGAVARNYASGADSIRGNNGVGFPTTWPSGSSPHSASANEKRASLPANSGSIFQLS